MQHIYNSIIKSSQTGAEIDFENLIWIKILHFYIDILYWINVIKVI